MGLPKVVSGLLLAAAAHSVDIETIDSIDGVPLMRKEVRAHLHEHRPDLHEDLATIGYRDGPIDRESLERLVEHHRVSQGFPKDVHPDIANNLLQAHADHHQRMNSTWNIWGWLPSRQKVASWTTLPTYWGWLSARASALAYRKSYIGLLINPLFLLHKKDMTDHGWKSEKEFNVNDYPGSDYAELWKHDDGKCILSFRGSDDLWDFVNDIVVNPVEYMGFHDVSKGVVNEFELLLNKMKETNGFQAMQACTEIAATGHSLGGALAALFAALANKEGDPMGAGIKVKYLYQFGPIPSATTPLPNGQSADGCFEGARFYNLIYGDKGSITDFAVWIGSTFSTIVGGSLRHAKIKAIGRDSGGYTAEEMTCAEAPETPAKNAHQDFLRNELNIPLHLPQLYISAMSSFE